MDDEQKKSIYEVLKRKRFVSPEYPPEGAQYSKTMRSWEIDHCGDLATWKRYVEMHRRLGYNSISIDIAWGDVEAKRGEYDFRGYDRHLGVIVDAGMTLQLKLNSRKIPTWAKVNRDALMCGPDGLIIDDGAVVRDAGIPSAPYHAFADPAMNKQLQGFYRAVAAHCRGLPNLFYCSAFACCFESEYHNGIWTDYSPSAQRQFREYMKKAYGSLKKLNSARGTRYAAWGDVVIDWQPPETMMAGRPDIRYVDFMKYREWSARLFFDAMHDAIKAGDPKAEYGPQVGRIVCQVGTLRGAISAFHWAENCEWIFVDPAPVDDYAWELAVARSGGKKVAVELDGHGSYSAHKLGPKLPVLYATHTRESYEHGADYVTHANWVDAGWYRRCVDEGMFERGAAAKQGVFDIPRATDAVFVGKWDSYLRKCTKGQEWAPQPGQVRDEAMARFQELRKQGKAVDVVMDDTILQNPAQLKQYARIHLCGARFIARPVWAALKKSGAALVMGKGTRVTGDETGKALPD